MEMMTNEESKMAMDGVMIWIKWWWMSQNGDEENDD